MKNRDFDKTVLTFRNTFPAYSQGVYINHAAVSPFSTGVQKSFQSYWEKRANMPVDVYPGCMEEKKKLKAMIGRLLQTDNTERIAFVPNTSFGLNMIATGLRWEEGDRIILNTIEFPANIYPFMNLERYGVIIDWVKPKQGRIRLEDIIARVHNNTRMVAISFVQFINGFKADLEEIGKYCKERGIWFVVDGIQGCGAIPINVQKCQIDAFVSSGHKWLMWPMGTGFMYLSQQILSQLRPDFVGWLSVKNSWDFFDYQLDLLDSAEKFEPGTLNYIGLYLAKDRLTTFLELGIENIHQRILLLTGQLIKGFKMLSLDVITPEEKTNRSGIVSIKVAEPEELNRILIANNIYAAVREGIVRFSPHFTNTIEDIDNVLQVVKDFVAPGSALLG